MRSPIRPLPTHLVNQIAAGEVVERPASVVKELVENALDAKASRIDVTIEGGGRDLVRVTDDGIGIPAEELPLALAPHATSKIARAEDLEAILTMGFRGEALASIASVSRVRIVSRTRDALAASAIEAEGDQIGSPQPAAAPPGTSITVQTLFYNVPARRKFLKSESAEAGRIVETLESIAMGHPHIRFTLTHGTKSVLDLAATDDPRRRASEVLDVERAALTGDKAPLLEASGEEGPLTVWGLVGRPELARANAKHLRIHLNGRPVADRAILHAVREAFRGLIAPGLTPLAAIFLELHPREVDVNVHPAKTEVRFRQPSMIHQGVLRAVRRALRAADLVPAFELAPASPAPSAPSSASGPLAWRPTSGPTSTPTSWSPSPRPVGGMPPLEDIAEALGVKPWAEPTPSSPATENVSTFPTVARAVEILQVHSAYVVTQDAEGILIVDQHALHERVMFEKLFERVARGPLERQSLLVPAIIECGPREIESLDALAPLFDRLGIEATPAGPRSIAVHAFPSFLFERRVDAGDFVRELVAKAADGTLGASSNDAPTALATEVESALADTLDMMACKAAVKAGDRLTIEELRELLEWRERVERSTNCPHGRPTSLRITMRDLERQFGRG